MFCSFWLVPYSLFYPYRQKKTPKNQGNSLGMFLKIRRRRILELSTGSGSIEQIFAMSSLCQDQGRLWRQELVVLLQGLSCRAVGSEAPTHPHCPLGICWLPLAGMWTEHSGRRMFCCVLVRALKSCRSDTRPWGPNLGVMGRSSGYLEMPWQQHLYLKSRWLRCLQALSWSRSWYQGSSAEEEHWREGG